MGRVPDQISSPSPSPKVMNNNFNPMFHAHPSAPDQQHVYEKQIVDSEQKYPQDDVGMVYQPSGIPNNMARPAPQPIYTPQMARPAPQPMYTPQMARPVIDVNQQWTSGLFDCMNDGENAIITLIFPFVTFGQIAEVTDEGATSCGTGGMLYGLICGCLGIPCIYSCTYRAKIRNKFGLSDAPAPDWITHCFCEYCALCQEYRELKNRGLDPSIGWSGNVQRQRMAQQQEMMAPPMGQRMMG
ncbi:unnamed protein product [Cochlearia groenlandica]